MRKVSSDYLLWAMRKVEYNCLWWTMCWDNVVKHNYILIVHSAGVIDEVVCYAEFCLPLCGNIIILIVHSNTVRVGTQGNGTSF